MENEVQSVHFFEVEEREVEWILERCVTLLSFRLADYDLISVQSFPVPLLDYIFSIEFAASVSRSESMCF